MKALSRWLEFCLVLALIALVVQLVPDLVRRWREWPWAGHQTPGWAELTLKRQRVAAVQEGHLPEGDGEKREVQYLLYLPPEYSKELQWPLLLFLHGSGQRGGNLDHVLKCGPPELIAAGRHLPMIVVTPQCRVNASWESDVLLALLDHVQERFAVDPDRVYVAGYSMGGFGCWDLAVAAPQRFAAIMPVAGGRDVGEAEALVNLPIWAFHGAKDEVVSVDANRKIVEAVQRAGGKAKLTVYEDHGHDTCNVTFARADVYHWLLRQRRMPPVAKR